MAFQDLPIKRQVMAVIMLTSISVLLLTATAFTVYDLVTYRQTMVRHLQTAAAIIADDSAAAILSQDQELAQQNLAALRVDPHIVAAALYDQRGNLYVRYPSTEPPSAFPPAPGPPGCRFQGGNLVLFQPATDGGTPVGTLFLESDLRGFYERLRLYSGIALLVLIGSVLVALAISSHLQRRITDPIRALADLAKAVSLRGDYSVRAQKLRGDELGSLTDTINFMLTRIEEQTVALKESEERLRMALESSHTGTWDWNILTNKITWDAYNHKLFGIEPGSFRGAYDHFLALLHPEDRSRVEWAVFQSLEQKTDYIAEFRVVWPDRSVHWLAAHGRALYSAEGKPARMSGVSLDVTERKKSDLAVRESQARFRAILESAIDCVITMDQEGRIMDFNPAAEKTFGFRREQVIGRTVAETIIPERLRAAHLEGLARFKTTGQGPVLGRRIEMPALRADGSEFPVELAVSSTQLEGGAFLFTAYLRDITERKRAEEALSLLAAIVESSDDAIVGKDLNSNVVSWNAGAERMFGYTAAEMLGQPITRLLSPDRLDEEPLILEEVKGGQTRHLETVRLHKNGRPIDVSLTVSPIKNPRGEIIGLSSTARDITTRNLVLRELRKSELQLRLIWENSLDGLRLVDREGIITMVNEAYCRLVEKPRSAIEGQPLSVLYESHRQEEVIRQHRERFAERGVPQHFEREVTLWNGKKLFLELSNSFLEVEGRPTQLVSTFRNITERRRAELREAAFAKLARSLSAAASAAAAARVIADVADELLGWDACSLDLYSAEQDRVYPVINIDTVEGKHLDVPPAYQAQPPSPIMRQVLAEGGQLVLRQPPYEFPPGSVPFGDTARPSASLMYVPVRLGQQIIGILSIQSYSPNAYSRNALATLQTLADQCAGALERVRAEENVRQLNEQLEQRVRERTAELMAANQDMEAFTYSVAHDLRAPLRHIDAFSRILYEDFADTLSPEAKHFLENILRASRNMSHLVEDLLNLARVGRQELSLQPTALGGLVAEVLADLKRETEGRSIEWHIQPLPTVECDSGLMKQVFANLLSNAVKYTRPRAIAVIEVGSLQANGQTSVFVRDNGVGFSMKYADKLFGVFQRLHRSEEFEGTGVGLATVDRIVRKHGGSVWAESEEDQGATFYFTLAGMNQEEIGMAQEAQSTG